METRDQKEGCLMANQSTKMASTLPNLSESEKQQKIATLAYVYWVARAFRKGSPETDWLRADRVVRGKAGTVKLRRTTVANYLVS
jgi:hypothetical protein